MRGWETMPIVALLAYAAWWRHEADLAWDQGKKETSSRYHQIARENMERARRMLCAKDEA